MYEPRLQNCQNQETDGQICVKFHNVQKMSNRCESGWMLGRLECFEMRNGCLQFVHNWPNTAADSSPHPKRVQNSTV
jgi:hypothetical protein